MLIDLLVNAFLVLLIASLVLGIVLVLGFIAMVGNAVVREFKENNDNKN